MLGENNQVTLFLRNMLAPMVGIIVLTCTYYFLDPVAQMAAGAVVTRL